MIGVRVNCVAAIGVPMRDFLPGITAVSRAMEIDATTDHMIGISRMDYDRITVRYLPFAFEMVSPDVLPFVTAVCTAKHSEEEIFIGGGFILRKRVDHIRIRGADGQTCPAEERRFGKAIS